MRLLLSTYTLNGFPLRDSFLLAKELGFDGVELVIKPSHVLVGTRRIREMSEHCGVPVLSVHQPEWHWPHTTKGMLRRLARFAKDVGAQNVTVHFSGLRFHSQEKIFSFIKSLEKEYGITVALENSKRRGRDQAPKWCWDTTELSALAARYGLNLTLDVPKIAVSGGEPKKFFKNLDQRIVNVHLHGSKKSKIHHSLLASDIDYRPFLKTLSQSGYCRLLTFEIFPLKHGASNANEVKETIASDLKLVLSYWNG